MEDFIRREEYSRGQGRIHARIDDIDKSVNRQEVIMEKIEESQEKFVKKIEAVMFGNGRTGMLSKFSNAIQELMAHRWFLVIIGTSLIGLVFYLAQKALTK